MRHLQAAGGTALRRLVEAPALLAVGLWFVGLALDQITKFVALTRLSPGEGIDVIPPVLYFDLYFNSGAAFGMGEDATVLFSVFAIVAALGCLFVALPRIRRIWHGIALGLLLAGITGNLYDRLFQPPGALHGHVIDFLRVPHFAVFNVADMCITIAAALIIVGSFLWERDEEKAK